FVGGTNAALISAIVSRIGSNPVFSSEDVRKRGGTSSNHFNKALRNLAIFWSHFTRDSLSAFVKININGRPFSPSQQQKSKSIFCGSKRESISTNTHCRFSLVVRYLRINFSQSALFFLEVCA